MIYIVAFYWTIAGFYLLGKDAGNSRFGKEHPIADLILSLIFGGIFVPVMILKKVLG